MFIVIYIIVISLMTFTCWKCE